VRVAPCEGVELTEVVSDVDAADEGGAAVIRVPDLLADEVRHLVLGVRLAPRAVPLDAPVAVAEVEVSFERLEGGRLVRERRACKAVARFVAAADAQAAPTPALDEVVAVAQLVRKQIEAEEAARQGRYREAHETMVLFQRAVVARGHDAVGAAAGKLADRLGSADAYDASTAYRSSMRKGGTRNVTSLYQSDAEADLRSMGRAVKTAAQDRMEEAFGAKRTDVPPDSKDAPASGAAGGTGGRRRLERRRSRRW
jgi:Ca-activated chloride channel homolog